jgi:hypothetical protein
LLWILPKKCFSLFISLATVAIHVHYQHEKFQLIFYNWLPIFWYQLCVCIFEIGGLGAVSIFFNLSNDMCYLAKITINSGKLKNGNFSSVARVKITIMGGGTKWPIPTERLWCIVFGMIFFFGFGNLFWCFSGYHGNKLGFQEHEPYIRKCMTES